MNGAVWRSGSESAIGWARKFSKAGSPLMPAITAPDRNPLSSPLICRSRLRWPNQSSNHQADQGRQICAGRRPINWRLRIRLYKDACQRFGRGPMASILLAEDDESLRRFLAAALERARPALTSFGDGAAAFECLQRRGFYPLLPHIPMPALHPPHFATL